MARTYVDRTVAEHNAGRLEAVGAAKAKEWATDVRRRVLDRCVQLHGGCGYMRETPVAKAFVDNRVHPVYGGSNEVMREVIGRDLGVQAVLEPPLTGKRRRDVSERQLRVCIIGAGPRGLSVLERLCADARAHAADVAVTVHVVDPGRPGPGRVWRTDQSRHLLMNTVASQVTLFTDPTVEMTGEIAPGPSLYEWARQLASSHCPQPTAPVGEDVLTQARELTPDSYPTRAFYGHYLEWVFRRVVRGAPSGVRVVVHPLRAVRLQDGPGGLQSVTLSNGTRIGNLDAVVLAQGHLPLHGDSTQDRLADFAARHSLVYLRPANPADLDLRAVLPQAPVLLRGLGLNFFDHMALFTLGRGGVFERDAGTGRLVYRPSGREPTLYAGSRRGVPYHSRGRNQKGAHGRHRPLLLIPAKLAELRRAADRRGLDFVRDLWPLIAKEVETVYYAALLTRSGRAQDARRFTARTLGAPWRSPQEAALLTEFGIPEGDRWDWQRVARPYGENSFPTAAAHRAWLLRTLRRDLAESATGNVDGPLKAALDVLRDLRNEIRLVVDHGGLAGRSHRDDLERWYTPLNAFLSIGPPPQRIEELIALVEAGVLHLVGPGMTVRPDERDGIFVAESASVPGHRVTATALVEARLPEPDLRRTADPLLRHLTATGQCRPYVIRDAEHGDYETGGLAVTGRPYRVITADGTAHPRRFAYGVPTESVHWVTAAGIRPGVNSVILADADAIALALLDFASADPEQPTPARSAPARTPAQTPTPTTAPTPEARAAASAP
ncbi:FAD/NAD(P)-binding protein [Streptomyces herbicida]|uniref:FAD/NAD(P)-binding protein n=1 Tax=Streptomyces herbicida TaxID=3065675 RepID=UPI0038CD16D8